MQTVWDNLAVGTDLFSTTYGRKEAQQDVDGQTIQEFSPTQQTS